MTWRLCLILSISCVVGVRPSASQMASTTQMEGTAAAMEQADFINRARAATEKYKHLENAIAAGFRKVGPDMPNMGEHWIQIRRVMQPSVDPDHPSTLTYLRVDGNPVLTGVAYTIPVQAGEDAPPVPVEGVEWHFHSGTIREELMGHNHPSSGSRLGMLHAWIWTDNPAGTFIADNWALSFVRLGLPVPAEIHPAAAKALFLLDGGVEYYTNLIAAMSDAPAAEIRLRLEDYRSRVGQLVDSSSLSMPDLAALWRDLWSEFHDVRDLN